MSAKILFASAAYEKYDVLLTLPSRFERLLDQTNLAERVKDKHTAIKMHLGRNVGYTTVHPLFIKILVDKLKSWGAKVYITDQEVSGARVRGYTEEMLGCPIVDVCGLMGKYIYPKTVDFKSFKNVDIGGYIHDADFMIDLSHVKGHGACGYGGACKNIAMGCVTDRTRQQLHGLEGGIDWNASLCTRDPSSKSCELCIRGCNHYANRFTDEGAYDIFFHHCTLCQHCVKVCPTGAITLQGDSYDDFQAGMALCTKVVLDQIGRENVYYINFLTNITALCDCWGLSTPSLVPDIGILASDEIIAIERASIDAIKVEDLLPNGIPTEQKLSGQGHLFEQLHGRNPYVQLEELEKVGLGSQAYVLEEVN